MTTGERVKELRAYKRLTLQQFGEILGIGKTAISKIEHGENALTEQNIKLICKEFGASENWLRTGEGEMFGESQDNENLKAKINTLFANESDSFRARLIQLLLSLNDKEAMILEQYARRYLLKDMPTAADQADATAADAKNPVEMTREEAATELNRQYDAVEEGKSTAVQDIASGSFG